MLISELEDECLKQVSEDDTKIIPWYLCLKYLESIKSDMVTYEVIYKVGTILGKKYNELDHKYKELIDPITLEVEEFPNNLVNHVKDIVKVFEVDDGKEK